MADFELTSLNWTPNQPEVMGGARIDVTCRNVGANYVPQLGTMYLELTLQDTNTDDEWFWRFPTNIGAVPTYAEINLSIENFLFTNDRIDKVQACLSLDDPESNPANNCVVKNITLHSSPYPWRPCAAMLIDTVVLYIDAHSGGAVDTITEMSRIYLFNAASINIACQVTDGECIEAVTGFLIDSAIALADNLLTKPVRLALVLIKDAIFLFDSTVDCAQWLAKFIHAAILEARHQGMPVNAVVAQSPVYIRVVDSNGRRAGYLDNGNPVLEIPDAEVGESNGTRVVLYPGTDTKSVELKGIGSGKLDLTVSISITGDEVHTMVYKNVSVTSSMKGRIDIASGQYTLVLDDNGDGIIDRNIQPTEEISARVYQIYLPVVKK